MEATSSRHRAGAGGDGGARKRRSAGGDGSGCRGGGSMHSLGADLLFAIFALLDHFDLVRCSAVCKSWKNIIFTSSLIRDLYCKQNRHFKSNSDKTILSESSLKLYLEELAMEEHRLSLLSGFANVHQLSGHQARINACRMKRGFILTGVGDKVLRLWSAQSHDYLDGYSLPDMNSLVDCDFDESKVVGLTSVHICVWRRHGQKAIIKSREGIFTRGLCMCYNDPEAVIGCEDGRARVFDLYGGRCSRIFRMHSGPVSCLALTDDQLILGGSTFGNVAIADLSSGERLGFVKSSFCPTGIKSLSFNPHSYSLFAGSTAGYVHCWDLRTLRPLWETRVSPNVIYSIHHLSNDTSTLAVGGLDGVLRILNQSTGETLSRFIMDATNATKVRANDGQQIIEKPARTLPENTSLDSIPKYLRPPITCLAVGMKKIVTTHNEKYFRIWRFRTNA